MGFVIQQRVESLAVYPAILRQHVFSFLELSRDIAFDQLECASL